LELALRKLASSTVKAQLAVRRIEREGLIQKVKNDATPASEKAAAHNRMAKIEYESRDLGETLELLLDDNRLSKG
jgi:hypothetical protein